MAEISFQPLNVTAEATHRVFVGLGWDPNESPTLKDTVGALIGTREKHHDLDLSCFYYDENAKALGYVTADADHYSNATGSIYHSGDDSEGIGDGDDEQISVELKNIPDDVFHIVFKASIKSGHTFDEIKDPSIRLCDGYTGRLFDEASLKPEKNEQKQDAFLFVHLLKAFEGWNYVTLNRFIRNDEPEKIQQLIAQNYLTNP